MVNDKSYYKTVFKILGPCVVVFAVVVFLYTKNRSEEYPILSTKDSVNDFVSSAQANANGSADVTLMSKQKFVILRSVNYDYQDYPNLAMSLTSGDEITKRKFSDTLRVKHYRNPKREYIYVMGRTIGKK